MPSCEYAETGFLSRRMRDEHLDSSHQEESSTSKPLSDDSEVDEIQPLFFDLVRLDKVEAVKSILHHWSKLNTSVQSELFSLVANSGSASMAQLLGENDRLPSDIVLRFLPTAIESQNLETAGWWLSWSGKDNLKYYHPRIVTDILKATLSPESR